jgi:hypothetical protein
LIVVSVTPSSAIAGAAAPTPNVKTHAATNPVETCQ